MKKSEEKKRERAYRAGFLEKAIHGKVEEAGAAKKLRRAVSQQRTQGRSAISDGREARAQWQASNRQELQKGMEIQSVSSERRKKKP
jgi:hypothetical protein